MSTKSRIRALGALALVLPFVVALATPSAAVTPPAGAFADSYGLLVDADLLEGNVPLDFGPEAQASSSCPPGAGGTKDASALSVGDPAAAEVALMQDKATTDCVKKSATSRSRIVNVEVLQGALDLHADVITSESTTSCAAKPAGTTTIVNLSIAGQPIPIPTDVPANTEIASPVLNALGLKIIANEQHPAAQGRGLVVNGLHIIANGSGALPIGGSVIRGDIVLAHAVSGVVCPGGPGTDNGGLPKPDISFFKSATPTVAKKGDTVVYTAVVTNQSTAPCEVLRFVDHIAPAFELVSSAGPMGTALEKPAPKRTDGGEEAVLHPTGLTIAPGKSVTQTFTVKVKADATPGTYYDTLEIFCGLNGNFVSGPLAPVTVPADGQVVLPPDNPVQRPTQDFAPTGLSTTLPAAALLLLVVGVAGRHVLLSRS